MTNFFPIIPFAFVALVGGRLLWGRHRYGSWTGSFVKGTVGRTVGEVILVERRGLASTMTVQTMESSTHAGPSVVLSVTSRAPLSRGVRYFALTEAQARDLARYLGEAAS